MSEWEKFERMAFVLGEIARGRVDDDRPLDAETSRQMAQTALTMIGVGWPYGCRPSVSPHELQRGVNNDQN